MISGAVLCTSPFRFSAATVLSSEVTVTCSGNSSKGIKQTASCSQLATGRGDGALPPGVWVGPYVDIITVVLVPQIWDLDLAFEFLVTVQRRAWDEVNL